MAPAINNSNSDSAPAASAPTAPRLGPTGTVILSDAGDDVPNLGSFFDEATGPAPLPTYPPPIPPTTAPTPASDAPATSTAAKGKGRAQNASPGPSNRTPPDNTWIGSLGLSDIPTADKRYDGKTEGRQLKREVNALAQATDRFHSEFLQHTSEVSAVMSAVQSQLLELDATMAALHTPTPADASLDARVSALANEVSSLSASVGAAFTALQSLIARNNGGPTPPPAPTPVVQAPAVPAPAPVAPAPVVQAPAVPAPAPVVQHAAPPVLQPAPAAAPIVVAQPVAIPAAAPVVVAQPVSLPTVALRGPSSTSTDGRMARLEGDMAQVAELIRELVAAKRVHSPELDARNVRQRALDIPALPIPVAAPPPAIAQPSVLPAPVPAPAMPVVLPAPAPAFAMPAAVAPAPSLQPPLVGVALPPPPPPPAQHSGDPARDARLGPVQWGRNITGEASAIIRAVLPAARGVMRNFRARRGPDQFTVIVSFDNADIASWFVAAWNAAPRASPYENVVAAANVNMPPNV